jgi:hypothetical protein
VLEMFLDTWLIAPTAHTDIVFASVATALLTLDPDLSPIFPLC